MIINSKSFGRFAKTQTFSFHCLYYLYLEISVILFVRFSSWHVKTPHFLNSIPYCLTNGVQFTKCGALFGEAVVINNPELDQDFRYAIKQHGAMLAKGRLLGLQFLALLNGEDGTGCSPYYTMATKADRQAMRIRAAFEAKGCAMLFDSPTNQQFPILPNSWYNALSEKYAMTLTAKPDAEHTAVRFCTSWATRDEDVDTLLADIANL